MSRQAGVRRIAGERPWVDADLSLRGEAIDDAALEALGELGPNLRALHLSGTAVTDEGVAAAVRRMPNLAILHLDRTAVTDAVLEPGLDFLGVNFPVFHIRPPILTPLVAKLLLSPTPDT